MLNMRSSGRATGGRAKSVSGGWGIQKSDIGSRVIVEYGYSTVGQYRVLVAIERADSEHVSVGMAAVITG